MEDSHLHTLLFASYQVLIVNDKNDVIYLVRKRMRTPENAV